MRFEVRAAEEGDLSSIVAGMGQSRFFVDCLHRQARGAGRLFVALVDGSVVGDVFLSLAPPAEPAIRRHLRGVPALLHLEVQCRLRRRGIGTGLIATAEAEAATGGATRVYLGVEPDNVDGRRLYERLGYEEWPHGAVATGWMVDRGGRRHYHRTTVHVLVKRLAAASPERA